MAKQEFPLHYLQQYIPGAAAQKALDYLNTFKVHLTITRERKSILGDYRHRTHNEHHRISVNGNLNPYAFLITLIHELAHLVTFNEYGNRVQSHGVEWKNIYRKLLEDFMTLPVFPEDIRQALNSSLHNLPASSCADEGLMRVLRKYDQNTEDTVLVEQVPEGHLFKTDDGRVFRKGKKLRKRFECIELATSRAYLFSPLYEVEKTA